jgi:hypothetical protein
MADKRFAALASDPRYRLPSKKQAQTAVDPRFKRLFTDQGFQKKATVDRYGRKLKPDSGKKDLEKRFRLEDEDEEDNEPKKGKSKKPTREVVGSSDESEVESDEGEGQVVDAARGGGFAESSSEEETSSEEEDSADEDALAEETAGGENIEEVPMGEVSKRIAAVNLDWDNIRAADIMAVAASFVPAGGRIENVTIYPSEFGRERMEREELEGPPREIFASTKKRREESEDDSDSDEDEDEKIRKRLLKEQAGEGEEFDDGKLRQYQLERLRYYYAVIECDSNNTAKTIYDSLDNREYLTTSNFFDLRFIPDEVTFDDDNPREHCTKLPDGYKPNDFRTEALTHSKVRLTWDDDDTTRKEVQKRAFSRAELDENDLQAYIGSDSSDNDSVSSRKSVTTAADRKMNKREAERQKMRAALGLSEAATGRSKKAKDEPVGDMQITFSSGLTSGKGSKGVFENEPQDEESTRQRYIRKEKERKARRKEKSKATRGEGEDAGGDHSGSEQEAATAPADDKVAAPAADEEDPFNDPFFNDPTTAAATEKSARKADKAKKRAERDAADAEAASRRAELELLMADDEANGEGVRHFDMREIEKAEKEARRKSKNKGKKTKKTAEDAVRDDFKVQAEDPRFKALFDSHEYAIDPTNPRFKSTEGMKSLLEEGRKKRKMEDREAGDGEEGVAVAKKNKKGKGSSKEAKAAGGDDDLKGLVARLKKGKSKSK